MPKKNNRRSQEPISVEPVWRPSVDSKALALAVLAFARQLAVEAEASASQGSGEEAPDA